MNANRNLIRKGNEINLINFPSNRSFPTGQQEACLPSFPLRDVENLPLVKFTSGCLNKIE